MAAGTTAALLASGVLAQAASAQPTISSSPNPISTNPIAGVTTLTANPASGSSSTPTYAWFDCDSSGANCSPTPIGTGGTYTVANSDIGSRIVVTETDAPPPVGTGVTTSTPTLVVVPPPPAPAPPSPHISAGALQVGQTLNVTQGGWTNSPSSVTDDWESCPPAGACKQVSQGTSYTLQPSDVGNTIQVWEYASNAGGTGGPAYSNSVGPVTPQPPSNTSPPVIVGSPAVGSQLQAYPGSWSPTPSSYTYQWLRCPDSTGANCQPIGPPAATSTYTVSPADLGHTIDVAVTAFNGSTPSAAVEAQSTTGPVASVASSISLLTLPGSAVTNQNVTLVASVASSSSAFPPSGTVDFEDGGNPISGCSAVAASATSQTIQVTCQASFSAASSPHSLTATFTPGNPALAGSTSQVDSLSVGRDSTSTQLDIPNPVVTAHHAITLTASVTPAHLGPVQPSGSVQFLDGGNPIAGCGSQPLVQSQGIESAQCNVTYSKRGKHSITAVYSGDSAFNGSNSASPSPQSLTVIRLGPRVRGEIVTKMQWTFRYTPRWTQVLAMLVHKAAVGTKIVLRCEGKGCPFKSRSMRIRRHHRSPNIARLLDGARFRPGTVLLVEFLRRDWIGKAYVFRFRSGHGPQYRIGCLKPGSNKFGKICT